MRHVKAIDAIFYGEFKRQSMFDCLSSGQILDQNKQQPTPLLCGMYIMTTIAYCNVPIMHFDNGNKRF